MTTRRRRQDPDTITRIRGRKVTIDLEDWRHALRMLKAALERREAAAAELDRIGNGAEHAAKLPLLDVAAALRAGGCDECDDACAGHGGCDFAFGEAPECGYVCEDGHIVLRGVET